MTSFRAVSFGLMLILCKVLSNDAIYSEEPAAISSTEAEYTGKDVILTGNVIVEQNLGKIRANRLVISPSSDSEKKIKFGFLQIDGDVIIEYARGGILHCQQAQIDYSALRAVFLGNLSEPDVVFIDKGRWDERKKITPFSMKSTRLQTDLIRVHDSKEKKDKTSLSHVLAEGDVRVSYDEDYLITSDYATYKQPAPDAVNETALLSLHVRNPEETSCRVTNQNGDRIEARYITIDTDKRILTCFESTGAVYMSGEKGTGQEVLFSSDTVAWDDEKQVLALRDRVSIKLTGLGELTTDKEVLVRRSEIGNKKIIQSILSPEETQLSYSDEAKNVHKLFCSGPLLIDHEKNRFY